MCFQYCSEFKRMKSASFPKSLIESQCTVCIPLGLLHICPSSDKWFLHCWVCLYMKGFPPLILPFWFPDTHGNFSKLPSSSPYINFPFPSYVRSLPFSVGLVHASFITSNTTTLLQGNHQQTRMRHPGFGFVDWDLFLDIRPELHTFRLADSDVSPSFCDIWCVQVNHK